MDLKKEVTLLIKNEVLNSKKIELFREPLIGFASANDPLFSQLKEIIGPHHILPEDILPEAKTVVSFFVPFSEHVVLSNRQNTNVSNEWAQTYLEANNLINGISEKLIKYLNEKGIKGETVHATHTYSEKTLSTAWSHRSAAFIAGLGRFGVNRMLITPVGCAGRYGSVIISEEISSDHRPEEELCMYLKSGQCGFCVKNCPTKALEVNRFDKHKCHNWLLEVTKGFSHLGFCDVCGKCVVGPCAILVK